MRRVSIALAAFALISAPIRAAEPNPHIVVFISDDHGYLDSQVAGDADVRTPNMLRLAEAGITFTHAFAVSPSCAPSRAALLTGLMPARNGSVFNHQPPRKDVKKLPAYLQALGYEVVAFGKVAHYNQAELYGFDHATHDKFHDHECVPAALKYLEDRSSQKPLCLLVGTNWPHVPWPKVDISDTDAAKLTLPPTHIDTPETRRWRARYYAAVEKMDADLGHVYDAAYKRLGQNTLFIHFSDHGAQWPFGKWNLYDAGTRVPFFAVWPDRIEPNSKSAALISLVDVLPTLVSAAGGKPPEHIDGQSLLGRLLNGYPNFRADVFSTHSGDGNMNAYPMHSIRNERWKYIRNLKPEAEHHTHIDLGKEIDGNGYWQSWVDRANTDAAADEIVARYHKRPAEELYDIEKDAYEQRNLAEDPEFTEALAHMRGLLDETLYDIDWMERTFPSAAKESQP